MRCRALILLLLALASPAHALTPGQRAAILSGVPAWVPRAMGVAATVACDFANGQYWVQGSGAQASCPVTFTRASAATDLLPASASGATFNSFVSGQIAVTPGFGVLVLETRTNLLLNSTAPATQTTGSLATGTYTLWVNGSGSATMSAGTGTGCGTGTATNGTPVNFTITVSGTCTVTKTGTLSAFQLELGSFGTALIVTAGSTLARAADAMFASGKMLTALQATTGTVLVKTYKLLNTASGNAFIVGDNVGTQTPLRAVGATTLRTTAGATVNIQVTTSDFSAGFVKSLVTYDGSGRTLAGTPGNSTGDSNTMASQTAYQIGAFGNSTSYADGYIALIAVFPNKVSAAAAAQLVTLP